MYKLHYQFTIIRVNWQQKHTDALDNMKRILTENPVLSPLNHNKDYLIMSEATDKTIPIQHFNSGG